MNQRSPTQKTAAVTAQKFWKMNTIYHLLGGIIIYIQVHVKHSSQKSLKNKVIRNLKKLKSTDSPIISQITAHFGKENERTSSNRENEEKLITNQFY